MKIKDANSLLNFEKISYFKAFENNANTLANETDFLKQCFGHRRCQIDGTAK